MMFNLSVSLFGLTFLKVYSATSFTTPTSSQHDKMVSQLEDFFDTADNSRYFPSAVKLAFVDCIGTSCNNCYSEDLCNGSDCFASTDPSSPVDVLNNEYIQDYATGGGVDYNSIISKPDFIVLAANVGFTHFATNYSQKPTTDLKNLKNKMKYGRIDENGSCPDEMPEEFVLQRNDGFMELKIKMQRAGLDLRDTAALLGAHGVGTQRHPAGVFEAVTHWTPKAFDYVEFDNYYYEALLGRDNLRKDRMGVREDENFDTTFVSADRELSFFAADLSLLADIQSSGLNSNGRGDVYCAGASLIENNFNLSCLGNQTDDTANKLVKEYRNNYKLWMNDFAYAWKKLTEKDSSLVTVKGGGGGLFSNISNLFGGR